MGVHWDFHHTGAAASSNWEHGVGGVVDGTDGAKERAMTVIEMLDAFGQLPGEVVEREGASAIDTFHLLTIGCGIPPEGAVGFVMALECIYRFGVPSDLGQVFEPVHD